MKHLGLASWVYRQRELAERKPIRKEVRPIRQTGVAEAHVPLRYTNEGYMNFPASPVVIAHRVEQVVRGILYGRRAMVEVFSKENPEDFGNYVGQEYTVPTFELYSDVQRIAKNEGFIVTAQFFNRLISDMKRAGIIGTAKGGEVVFLSLAAFQEKERERHDLLAATEEGGQASKAGA